DYSPNRNRSVSGAGIVFSNAPRLRNVTADLDNPASLPPGMRTTEIIGPIPNAIGSDTIGIGDFNGDGLGDIAIGNPHDAPFGRTVAGSIHTFYGRVGGWPAVVDTAVGALPNVNEMQISLLQGGFGTNNQLEDAGDTLCYSADFCDFDGDGITDLIANEMQGNGISPNTIDVGNLLVLSGRLFSIVVETVPTEDRWIFK
ncbi:MAG: FG-GAP repeat protein, partial [Candidatus Sumerlaeia bacterium]|nr:FG-GAP repeat protein [Candidatus Sumerlaeia bacterium]